MIEHRYILEPYKGMKTRYQCPSCQHKEKSFTLYVDTIAKKYINAKVGRCSRESNCGYHYTPKQYFQDHSIPENHKPYIDFKITGPRLEIKKQVPFSNIPDEIFKASLGSYEKNHFISFLISKFGIDRTTSVINQYFIGSSHHWKGSTVFWQIDPEGKVRTGKIILYNPTTGKRVKEPRTYINWVHSVLALSGFDLKQVLFGSHLIIGNTKPCAIVESEKSAIIASIYFPQFTWLATGSLSNLTDDLCEILKGRKVILFPDLKGYDKWKVKASEMKCLTDYAVSDLLERKASPTDKESGLDIADYLLRFDLDGWNRSHPNDSTQIKIKQVEEKPFEETLLYHQLMFDMMEKYFGHPLLSKLRKEPPFTGIWTNIYLQIRKSNFSQSKTIPQGELIL